VNKKEAKKTLIYGGLWHLCCQSPPFGKSFLVLFFKKERSYFTLNPPIHKFMHIRVRLALSHCQRLGMARR